MYKFLLAENPMRPGESDLFIIHMLQPIAIIQCIEGHVNLPEGKLYKHFSFQNPDSEIENWTLCIYHLFTTELDSEQHDKIVIHLLDRAWRWYRSYMTWEDKNFDNE